MRIAIVILGGLVATAHAEPALRALDGPHATAFADTCASVNDGRTRADGRFACRRIASKRRVGPFARVAVYQAGFDAYVAIALGADWYVGAAVPIDGWSDPGYAEVVTIRRVVIRKLPGKGAVLRFRMRDAEYDRCSLRDESCRDHRLHLSSKRTYDLWQVCAVVGGVPACSEPLEARPR